MRRLFVVIGLLLIFGASAWYGYNRHANNPDPNHTHADFAVWINGSQVNFAQEKYMTEELTDAQLLALEQQTGTGKDLQTLKQDLHLHDMNGHVLHRHKPGLGFGDFLKTLGFTLTDTCLTTDAHEQTCNTANAEWQLWVNNKKILPFDANYVFTDGDHILLTYGASASELAHEESLMTDDACKYSKTCPGRGAPPTESCIADPTVPCKLP